MFNNFDGQIVDTAMVPLQNETQTTQTKNFKKKKNQIHSNLSADHYPLLQKDTSKHILLVFNPVKIQPCILDRADDRNCIFPVAFYMYSESRTVLI